MILDPSVAGIGHQPYNHLLHSISNHFCIVKYTMVVYWVLLIFGLRLSQKMERKEIRAL